jgi:hypothetical protein
VVIVAPQRRRSAGPAVHAILIHRAYRADARCPFATQRNSSDLKRPTKARQYISATAHVDKTDSNINQGIYSAASLRMLGELEFERILNTPTIPTNTAAARISNRYGRCNLRMPKRMTPAST